MWTSRIRKGHKARWKQGFASDELILRCVLSMIVLSMGLLVGLCPPLPVRAQVPEGLNVLPPDTEAFPILSVQFKPRNVSQEVDFELGVEDLTVIENGRVRPPLSLEKHHSGVHFTLVINGDRRFDLRDATGISPYDRIRDVLINWAELRRFATEDTLSLFTQEGPVIRNTPVRMAYITALENYQPNFRTMTPDLASLESALRAADERVVPFGVDKALLYITPPPNREEISTIVALTEAARSAGIQVNVWMLGEEFFLTNDQGGSLMDLAAVTGGQFFHYNGVDPLPNPETYLGDLGIYYTLRFESGIREAGTYGIRVVADLPVGELHGESGDFFIDVQPPKPILISPPAEIVREPPQRWEGDPGTLTPTSIDIEFMLEFPDRYPRDLAAIWLYVDGRVVDMKEIIPFSQSPLYETLTWDLTDMVEPGEYMFQVKVEDTLGLSVETILTPIRVEFQLPQPEHSRSIQQIGLIIAGSILAAAVILLLIWAIRRFLQGAFVQKVAKKLFDSTRKMRPPGMINQTDGLYATLLPLTNGNPAKEVSAISITKRQMAFGCDPDRADQVLMGEEVSGLHARLRVRDGACWLSDSGSSGGTWVNYDLIGREPVRLCPGDLIHFGAVGFRFTMIDAVSPPSAAVSKYEPIL